MKVTLLSVGIKEVMLHFYRERSWNVYCFKGAIWPRLCWKRR